MAGLNSVPLVTIASFGALLLLPVYLLALCKQLNRIILGAGAGNCFLVLSLCSTWAAATCVGFCVWFLETQTNEDASIMGLRWKEGGELLVCLLYGCWLALSVLRVPVAIISGKNKWRLPVSMILVPIGVCGLLIMIASFSFKLGDPAPEPEPEPEPPAFSGVGAAPPISVATTTSNVPSAAVVVLYQLAAVYVFVHSVLMENVVWTYAYWQFVRRPTSMLKDALLPTDLPGRADADGRDRRASINGDGGGSSCLHSKRLADMKTSTDWWAVWIGSANLAAISLAVGLGAHSRSVPILETWSTNPLKSIAGAAVGVPGQRWCGTPCELTTEAVLWGVIALLGTLVAMLIPVAVCTAVTQSPANVMKVVPPFVVLFLLTCLARVMGTQDFTRQYGLSATLWALVLGLLIVNGLKRPFPAVVEFLKPAAKQGEFFIKIGLVLLCVEFGTLASYGLPALIVSWVVTPIVLLFGWWFGRRVCSNGGWLAPTEGTGMSAGLVMCLAAGTSVCGTSAIAAIKSAIGANQEESVLAISIVSFMTIFFMLGLPYFAILARIPMLIAGAWIGGTVNNTGNVVAAAAILQNDEAEEVAAIVKMLQNAMIGVITVVVTAFWVGVVEPDADPAAKGAIQKKSKGCWQTTLLLYDRFPKFVLGFFVCSVIVTVLAVEGLLGPDTVKLGLLKLTGEASDWWNIVGFVGLGLETDIGAMTAKLKSSGGVKAPLYLYFATQTFNAVLTLGASYFAFGVLHLQDQV